MTEATSSYARFSHLFRDRPLYGLTLTLSSTEAERWAAHEALLVLRRTGEADE
jgi:hypothetical protein